MRRAVGVIGLAVSLLVLSAVVVDGAAAKPSGPGPGNKPNAKLCQNGGWQSLVRSDGTSFASEEECTAYAAQGHTLQPKPTFPQALALCTSYNGTFGAGGPDLIQIEPATNVVWVCNGVPFVDVPTLDAQRAALGPQCTADSGQPFGLVDIRPTTEVVNFTCYNVSPA